MQKVMSSEQVTGHTNLKPHTGYKRLYAVLPYEFCKAFRLLSVMTNHRESYERAAI